MISKKSKKLLKEVLAHLEKSQTELSNSFSIEIKLEKSIAAVLCRSFSKLDEAYSEVENVYQEITELINQES